MMWRHASPDQILGFFFKQDHECCIPHGFVLRENIIGFWVGQTKLQQETNTILGWPLVGQLQSELEIIVLVLVALLVPMLAVP